MPTDSTVTTSIIDPVEETVNEVERAVEAHLVHIEGPETITGLKRFTQPITAPTFVGTLSGHLASGVQLLGPIDMNGFGFINVSGSGFELLSNKGAANGYAPLGATGLVPAANLGTGGSGIGTNFLGDDGVFRPISAGAVSFGSQTANRVFAGPTTGSAAAPAFRALVAADIPALAENKITGLETDLANKVPITRTIREGDGLAGNIWDLSASIILSMGTPSAVALDSLSEATGTTHSHAVTASANPGATASLLATDASGYLTLKRVTLTDRLLINALTANLYLKDTSTGFQAATTGVITPQAGNVWRNTSYTSGLTGWNVDDHGNAEFNNLLVRGSIKAAVFTVNEIAATAGTLGVFYSAATVQDDFTTPASTSSSFAFNGKNSDAGGMLFAVGDIVRFKTWTGSGISDSWATITARTNHTTYTTYTATLNNGSTSATFRAGTAAVDYGPSGTGFITLSADGTVGSSPNLTMATHAGSPWSAFTTILRAGNLNGSYGYASATYGVGIGQYGASASWITIDTTNGIRIGNNTIILGQWDASGNATFGQVDTNQANVYWNNSNKRLQFRGSTSGTVVQSYIDTDGSFNAGAGAVRLDADGLTLTSNISQGTVLWKHSGAQVGQLLHSYTAGTFALFTINVNTKAADTTAFASISLAPLNNLTSDTGTLKIVSYGSAHGTYPDKGFVTIAGDSGKLLGVTIGSTSAPAYMLDVYGTGRFSGTGAVLTAQGSSTGNVLLGELGGATTYGAIGLANSITAGNFNFASSASDTNLYINRPTGKAITFSENNVAKHVFATNNNVGLGVTSFGTSAVNVIGIANGTAPSTSPAGMGQLYVVAGALLFRGSSGTVTPIAPA